MPVGSVVADYRGQVPMLLKADGTNYAGMTYVKAWTFSYERKGEGSGGVEVIQLADNDEGWARIGSAQQYIDSFSVEAWSQGAAEGIKNDIANPDTEGKFMLEVPDVANHGNFRYIIRFGLAEAVEFTPMYSRRAGFTQVWEAQITNIKVIERLSY